MTGSAQLETLTLEAPEGARAGNSTLPSTFKLEPSALKLDIAERVAAHRRRKTADRGTNGSGPAGTQDRADGPEGSGRSQRSRAGQATGVAAAVAERYAQTPSYRAFLAEQAQRAIAEAAARAEVAVRSAQAVAEAQQTLLAELEQWTAPQEFTPATAQVVAAKASPEAGTGSTAGPRGQVAARREQAAPAPVRLQTSAGLTVRLYEPAGPEQGAGFLQAADFEPSSADSRASGPFSEGPFSAGPFYERPFSPDLFFANQFSLPAEAPVPLAANLLEFPRQLVAARKARPRLAEGPLREQTHPRRPQLRIFEVEAEQFAAEPSVPEPVAHQSFIFLEGPGAIQVEHELQAAVVLPPQIAPISQRLLALVVDAALVGCGVAGFMLTASRIGGRFPGGATLAMTAAAVLAIFWAMYQMLFFTLSDGTPGMRWARIALCTLGDDNPTRRAMRRRVLAQGAAVLPLGLGIVWALVDDDRLGWHDRLSKMYQRAY